MTDTETLDLVQEVGDRFHPTNIELVSHFLRKKLLCNDHQVRKIPEVEVYKFEPYDLPEFSGIKSNDQEWYFFCRPHKKYRNSDRINRRTEAGHWKSTGKDRKIKNEVDEVIGTKKILVYMPGSSNRSESKWTMHEYRACLDLPNQRDFVLCKLMKKPDKKAKKADNKAKKRINDGEKLSISTASDFEMNNPKEITVHSTISEGESSCGIISCADNGKSDKMINDLASHETNSDGTMAFHYIPTCSEEGEASSGMAFDIESENLYQKTDNSTCDEAKSEGPINFTSKNHVADDTIPKEMDTEPPQQPNHVVYDTIPTEVNPDHPLPCLESFVDCNEQDYIYGSVQGTHFHPWQDIGTSWPSLADEDNYIFEGLEPLCHLVQ